MQDFSFIDGAIVLVYIAATMTLGIMVRKYVGRVEDFIVAGRGVNLHLGIASLAATEFGIVTCMYTAQNGFNFGFAGATPGILYCLSMLFIGLTGFCVNPLRNANVMTIPELFEKVYGSRVRWLAGLVIVLGGLLNMGMFLRVGGEFLVHFIGLPPQYLEITMTVLLIAVATYTIVGGMLSVLITDFLQFLVMSLGMIVVTILVLVSVGWSNMAEAVQAEHGAGGLNPIIHDELGPAWLIFNVFVALGGTLTWQVVVQRILASKDAKTGRRMYMGTSVFFICRFVMPGIWGIAALTILGVGAVDDSLHAMPTYLSGLLPVGIMGILLAAMLAADMSTNSSYMLSWGSVIYNDLMAPIHRNQWSERTGILVNRIIVGLIGAFLLFYGLWYELRGALWDYLALTGTIYFSSMLSLLIACCYWKRANNWGAYAAIIVGAVLPCSHLILGQIEATQEFADWIGAPIAGIAAFVGSGAAMVIGSLLKPQPPTEYAQQ